MSDASPHWIRRLRWRVQVRSEREAFEARQALRGAMDGPLLAALERAFDEQVPPGEVLRVSRLELRVRVASVDEFRERLPALVSREIAEKLRALPGGGPVAGGTPDDAEVRRGTVARDRVATLRRYLASGRLEVPLDGAEREAVDSRPLAVSREELAEIWASLDDGVSTGTGSADGASVARCFRLLQITPESEWIELAHHRPMEVQAVLAEMAVVGGAPTRHARLYLAAVVLAAGRDGEVVIRDEVATALSVALGGGGGEVTEALLAGLPHGARRFLQRALGGAVARRSIGHDGAADSPKAPARERTEKTSMVERVSPVQAHREEEASPREAPGMACGNAGLVLLHPYVARFFDHVGVRRDETGALAAAGLPRAAALLHLLATGDDEAPEFELPIVKVLLGVPLRTPLVFGAGLVTDADREEADGMLRAVVEHWSALKKTSPQGLRATFLQRRGLLREGERGWQLQVAPAGVDVLLAQLPWAVSIVKLPWMPRPVFTEWPTP